MQTTQEETWSPEYVRAKKRKKEPKMEQRGRRKGRDGAKQAKLAAKDGYKAGLGGTWSTAARYERVTRRKALGPWGLVFEKDSPEYSQKQASRNSEHSWHPCKQGAGDDGEQLPAVLEVLAEG